MPTTPVLSKALFQVNTADDPGPLANPAATNSQYNSSVVGLTNGNFLVVWEDGTARTGLEPNDIIGQLFDSGGNKIGAEFIASVNYEDLNQQHPDVIALPGGGFAVVYQTTDATGAANDGENVTAEIFDSTGAWVRTDDFRQGFGGPQGIDDTAPTITGFSDGGYVVVYEERDTLAGSPVTNLSGYHVSSTGVIGSKFAVEAVAADVAGPQAATLSNGNFVVAFETPGTSTVNVSVHTSAGAGVTEFAVATTHGAARVDVAALGGGGFVVVWQDSSGDGAGNAGIRAAVYDNAGGVVKAAFAADITTTAGAQSEPAVTALGDGGFVVAWNDEASGTVKGQAFTATGVAAGSEVTLGSLNDLGDPALGLLANGNFVVTADNQSGGDLDVEAAIWDAVDNPPVAVNDAVTAVENAVLNGNVLVANPTTADSDVDGPGLTVFAVNGLAGNVGSQITLASGAKLTLNGNGTFAYDPNHAFDALPDFAASGASNTTATDSFTYTLTGGGTATVTVTVRGVDSNDTLHGTVGTDALAGGTGNDTYYVENGTDTVTEAGGAGADVVYASVSYALQAGQEVEVLKNGAGATALTLTGNGFANAIVGGTGADTLIGLGGDDTYYVKNGGVTVTEAGGGGADTVKAAVSWAMQAGQEIELLRADAGSTGITLTGNERANAFISGAGNDTLIGLGGDDTYYVNNAGDLVTEALNGGLDTVKAGVSWAMQAGQEIEKLMANAGATGLTLTGNELSNLLQGNAGADRLIGGLSIDSMIGAGGNDTFVFNTLADSGVTTPDLIYDFSAGDKIDVSAIDADGNGGNGDTAFILDALGDNSFATGHIKQTLSGTSLYLSFNADGDAISEMTIRLLNHPAAIGSGDIIA